MANVERELVSTDELLDHALRHMEAVHKHNVEPLMEARVLVEAARRQHADQLRGAVEERDALRKSLRLAVARITGVTLNDKELEDWIVRPTSGGQ